MSRVSQGSFINSGNQQHDDYDRASASTPRQSMARTSSYSASSSMTRSASRSSYSGSYSEASSRTRDYRDSKYSTETRTTTTMSLGRAEVRELEDMIHKFKEQLDFHKRDAEEERRRADAAVKKTHELAEHIKKVNELRLVAQQDANKANEELRLYKLQLEYAQREINRAQAVLEAVDKQRVAAEKQAADARATARRLNEELLIEHARREGRRVGMQEGLVRGRTLGGPDLTRPMVGQRSSYLDRASFMGSETGTDDSRTLSSMSLRSSLSGRTENRPQSFADNELRPRTPSPPPVPVPQPRPASEFVQTRPPSVMSNRSEFPPANPAAPRPRSRASSVVRSEVRPRSRAGSIAPSVAPSERPRSRAGSVAPSVAPSERPRSRAGSIAPSIVPSERPHSRAGSVAPSELRPRSRAGSIAPSEVQPPSNLHNPTPSPGLTPIMMPHVIPPDNFIPVLGEDGLVHLPPPHEFLRRPHTPEGSPNPYTYASLDHHHQRQPSIESSSTAVSDYDKFMNHNPATYATPALSAIQEVYSNAATPLSTALHGHDLRHQRSMSGNSMRSGQESYYDDRTAFGTNVGYDRSSVHSRAPSVAQSIHQERTPASSVRSFRRERSRSPASVAQSIQPPASVAGSERSAKTHISAARSQNHERPSSVLSSRASHAQSSSKDGSIHIDIHPPSRPLTEGTRSINSKSALSPLHSGTAPLPSVPLPYLAGPDASFGGMPGGIEDPAASTFNDDVATQVSGRPKDDDDAVSSRLSGDESLTTPPPSTGLPRSWTPPAQSTVSSMTAVSSKSKGKGKKSKRR